LVSRGQKQAIAEPRSGEIAFKDAPPQPRSRAPRRPIFLEGRASSCKFARGECAEARGLPAWPHAAIQPVLLRHLNHTSRNSTQTTSHQLSRSRTESCVQDNCSIFGPFKHSAAWQKVTTCGLKKPCGMQFAECSRATQPPSRAGAK